MSQKIKNLFFAIFIVMAIVATTPLAYCQTGTALKKPEVPAGLIGHRFLTLNTVVRVNQIEVARDINKGMDESRNHTPEAVIAFREAVEKGFPGARITWSFSWRALHDTTANYREIRKIVAGYHRQYGDDVTFIPGGYFANAYSTYEQVNKDLHEGLAKVSEIVGGGFRPQSVVAGFLAAPNLQYLAEKENIHVCQGTIWSQFAIDNQDGDGSVCYPYYPSKEHFCKPAQGKDDFIDCVNLDGWSIDFLAGRRPGGTGGFNSRMGVGPIETFQAYGPETGLKEVMHTTAIHFDKGFELNGFAWVPNCWELILHAKPNSIDVANLTAWLKEVRSRWPDTKMITQGEFGLLWRKHYKKNSFDYRFVERGSGIGGSDADKDIRWFMNKNFRLALMKNWQTNSQEEVIDFTRYDIPAKEPQEMTRKWSLLGEINQKQTRPQDKPVPLDQLPEEYKKIIRRQYPYLFPSSLTATGQKSKPETVPAGVVLLDAEHPTAHFAAREFQRYIYLRTGVLLNIEKPQTALKINTDKKAKKKTVSLTIDSATFGNDEYRIKTEGNLLSVTGGSSTGLLYGVYRTLEHFGIWTEEDWTWKNNKPEATEKVIADILLANQALDEAGRPFRLATAGWVVGPAENRALPDEKLPENIAVSSISRNLGHEPIDTAYAKIRRADKWAIPWMESDGIHGLASPQIFVARTRKDAADALAYSCNGLLGLHWRTEEISPNLAALAQAAWNQTSWNPSPGTVLPNIAPPLNLLVEKHQTFSAGRGLESQDFWQDWTTNMFGAEIAEDAAEIFNSIDERLPTTVANACPAGSLRADTGSWENVQRRYAFVDMFAKLRSRISSSGYRERFDFWQSFFFYDRELAHLRCTLGKFERLAKEIEKEQTEPVKKTRAQNELLPVFAELVQQFGAASTYLQETVTTNGGLMTVVFMEQCQSWRNTVFDAPQKRLETLSGEPVPHSVAAWNDYRGRERIFIPTLRTTVLPGESLELDIIIHAAKPPKNAVLFWKTMGANEPYQKSKLRPVHGNHYAAALPPLDSGRNAIEYYIEAETENPQGTKSLLRFPSTAPERNQTVIVFFDNEKYKHLMEDIP